MDNLADWGVLASWAGALIGFVALLRAEIANRRTSKLAAIQQELGKRQLKEYEERETDKEKTDLQAHMEPDGSNYRIVITNIGRSEAKKVYLSFPDPFRAFEIPGNQIRDKVNYPLLLPGQSFSYNAVVPLDSTITVFPVSLRWYNKDDTYAEREQSISLP